MMENKLGSEAERLTARQRGYTREWERARADFLRQPENQFCVKCRERGLLNPGNLHMDGTMETNPRRISLRVDHITPHRGDQRFFWDRLNWQPLCADDHDIIKQREEHGIETGAVDTDGRPTDPDHPWNQLPP